MKAATNLVSSNDILPIISVELVDKLPPADMEALCDVIRTAIEEKRGFGWQKPPPKHILERYWQGVLVVPERSLIVARIDNVICGAIQLVEPSQNNEIQSFSVNLFGCFNASWADGYNISAKLIETAENLAIEKGFNVINIDIQETELETKLALEKLGYKCWGTHPHYVGMGGQIIKGLFFTKLLHSDFSAFKENRNDMKLNTVYS